MVIRYTYCLSSSLSSNSRSNRLVKNTILNLLIGIISLLPVPLQSHVQIGIVGKPNVGKSTFFAAATMIDVKIAPYPFTTIEPNVGIGYVRIPCVCRNLGVKDNPPRNSICIEGNRFIPVELIDVAGLVPGGLGRAGGDLVISFLII